MDWNKIKEKNPKAFDLAQGWWADNNTALIAMPAPIYNAVKTIRDLFPFFNEQGIYGNVFVTENDSGDKYFDWEVFMDSDNMGSSEVEEPTRTEAEEKLFEREFEILENKIGE